MSRIFRQLIRAARALKPLKQTGMRFHVAFILNGSKIIAIGFNNYNKSNRTCARYKSSLKHVEKYEACIHAEVDATAKIKYRDHNPKHLVLISIRINNKNQIDMARPCPNCAYHLGIWGYKKVFYSDALGQIQRLIP